MATVQNIVVNELLCFLSNKVRSMTYDSLMKLCMDFYDEETVIAAKTTLLEHVVIPEGDDKRKRRIGANKKATSMKDILSVFLELTLEDVPLFVANNLHNLPPLSMDNFDMSRVIRDMEVIKLQMKVLQEAQETSLAAHVAICRDRSRDVDICASPTYSTGTPPTPVAHTPQGDPPTIQETEDNFDETTITPPEHRRNDDDEHGDEDILRLAWIQGRLPVNSPRHSRDRQTNNNNGNGNSNHQRNQNSVTSSANVWSGRLNSYHGDNPNRQPNMNYHGNPNRFNNSRGDHGHRRQARDNSSVITGTSTNCSLSAATPRGNPRQSRKDGLFISRLSRNTRAIDVMNYIRNEANLNIRCDHIATRYDTYRSYYVHAAPHHHALLLKAGMWPRDVLVKKYNPK